MKLIHTSTHSAVESRLDRLSSGRHRRRLRRHETPAPSNSPRGSAPKKAA